MKQSMYMYIYMYFLMPLSMSQQPLFPLLGQNELKSYISTLGPIAQRAAQTPSFFSVSTALTTVNFNGFILWLQLFKLLLDLYHFALNQQLPKLGNNLLYFITSSFWQTSVNLPLNSPKSQKSSGIFKWPVLYVPHSLFFFCACTVRLCVIAKLVKWAPCHTPSLPDSGKLCLCFYAVPNSQIARSGPRYSVGQ